MHFTDAFYIVLWRANGIESIVMAHLTADRALLSPRQQLPAEIRWNRQIAHGAQAGHCD